MLKGNLKCNQINKMLLGYIHFELTKTEMERVALHLRNCPNCMKRYIKIQKRKKELKRKMYEIEKTLRMEKEISTYIDNEGTDDLIFITEGMLLCDEKYRKELVENENLRRVLQACKKEFERKQKGEISEKIIQNLKEKRKNSARNFIQPFLRLLHGFLRFQ